MKTKNRHFKSGFSLIEVAVIICVAAVLAIVLTPSLTHYVEDTRKQKDAAHTAELVRAAEISLSDDDCLLEVLNYSIDNNFITYSDSSGDYGAQMNDEEYFAPDGLGKGVTITFNPDENGDYYVANGIINDTTFGNGSVATVRTIEGNKIKNVKCYLSEAGDGYLYAAIKRIVGDKIECESKTYKKSSFTLFIHVDEEDGVAKNVSINGYYNGTNLTETSNAAIGTNTLSYESDGSPIKTATGGHIAADFATSGLALGFVDDEIPTYMQIQFTVNGKTESAEINSTWQMWFSSSLNVNKYSAGQIITDKNDKELAKNTKIEKGKTYKIKSTPMTSLWYKIEGDTVYIRGHAKEGYTERKLGSVNGWTSNTTITKAEFEEDVYPTNCADLFYGCSKLNTINNMNYLHTEETTNTSAMFYDCSGLTELNVSKFDTSNVTNMDSMVRSCSGLKELDVSKFDTSKVTSMSYMFSGCSGLTELDVSNFNTEKVTSMSYMFRNCASLNSLDTSNWNGENVKSTSCMFAGCSSITTLDLSKFHAINLTGSDQMFSGCKKLSTLNLDNFDGGKNTSMFQMFYECSSLTELDLSDFDTSSITSMAMSFAACYKLTTIYVGPNWNTDGTTTTRMFENCGTDHTTLKS